MKRMQGEQFVKIMGVQSIRTLWKCKVEMADSDEVLGGAWLGMENETGEHDSRRQGSMTAGDRGA